MECVKPRNLICNGWPVILKYKKQVNWKKKIILQFIWRGKIQGKPVAEMHLGGLHLGGKFYWHPLFRL